MRYKSAQMQMALICSAFLFLLTSCAEDVLSQQGYPIRLAAQCEQMEKISTRAGTSIQGGSFDEGEKIKAYITDSGGEEIGAPTIYTTKAADGHGVNELNPNVQPYYPNKDVTVDVYAYYPPIGLVFSEEQEQEVETEITSSTTSFSVSANQQSGANYKKSDLLYASVSDQPRSEKTINLHFRHLMSKLVVDAEVRDELKIKSIVVKSVKTTMDFDVSTGMRGSTSNTKDIVLYKTTDNFPTNVTGAILFPPQTLSGDFIEVETDKGTAKFVIASKNFDEGVEYTANLVVSRESLNLSASIINWNEEEGVVPIIDTGSGFAIVGDITPYTYDGQEHKPVISDNLYVQYGKGNVLSSDYYDIEYYNNVKAGTALMVAFGKKGDVLGKTAIKTYIIQKHPYEMHYTYSEKTESYLIDGIVENPLVNPGDGSMHFSSSDTNIATVDAVSGRVTMMKDGTVKISVSMDNNGNYEAGTAEYTLTINKRDAESNFIITFTDGDPNYTYDGNKKEPTNFKVEDTNAAGMTVTLEEGTDYTVGYSNNINAGTNTAKMVITGINKYKSSKSKDFTIKKAQAIISMPGAGGKKIIGIDDFYDCQATTNIGTINYTSADENIAKVSHAGIVTGVAASSGYINISASVTDDPAGNYIGTPSPSIVQIKVEQMAYDFPYKSGNYSWTTPVAATYTFELVGGAGGNANGGIGGKGGLVRASKYLNAGQTIVIYTGGGGTVGTAGSNGGGAPAPGCGGGGGATEVRIGGNRVLVAGGGGGATNSTAYGRAGGERGSGNGTTANGVNADTDGGGGGGAGYLGGTAGSSYSGGYGGSNYIANDYTVITNGTSTNGATSGSDTSAHNGWVNITYKYE